MAFRSSIPASYFPDRPVLGLQRHHGGTDSSTVKHGESRWGSRWNHGGITVGSRWDHGGDHGGITMGSRWNHGGDHGGITVESRWRCQSRSEP
eukprot:gene12017-biopygen3888